MKTIYLHIGCEKTGTTSIQHFLTSNRKELELQGIAYPHLGLNETAHFNLVASINSWQNKSDGVDYYPNKEVNVEQEWSQFKQFYHTTECKTIILSAEHFSSRLKETGIHRLKSELCKIDENLSVKIVLYIRRQDWFIESSYSTAIKAGRTNLFEDFFKANLELTHRYDFNELIARWSDAFSAENIIVVDYDEVIATQKLIPHFCNIVNADVTKLTLLDKIENPAWSPAILEFVRLSNSPRIKQQLGNQRLAFFNYINDLQTSDSTQNNCLMKPEQRQLVLEKYQESNAKVQNKYFKNGQLFAKAKNANLLKNADSNQCTRQFIIDLLVKTYLDTSSK